jgi:xanthosine phosphorylase
MAKKSNAAMAVSVIKKTKPNFIPKIGIILGSGLGKIAEQIENATVIPYDELPGFPECSVVGHAGNLVLGEIHGINVALLQGRGHLYEGEHLIPVIRTYIRTLKLLGCDLAILTNAAGSFREDVAPGNLMLITDHINFQFNNPLVGSNDDEFGPKFFSMENAYDKDIGNKFLATAEKLKIKLAQGVYLAVSGPNFETPAEIRAYRTLGADAVGMSTVPEVLVARHCGLKVACISVITNLAAGMNAEPLSHEQTLRCAKLAVDDLTNLLLTFVGEYKNG